MSLASIEDLLAQNVLAKATAVMASRSEVEEVRYRLGDFGDHQRVEVLVVVADGTTVDRDFRHTLEQAFAGVAQGPAFGFLDLPPWPLLKVASKAESTEILEAAGQPWRTTTTS